MVSTHVCEMDCHLPHGVCAVNKKRIILKDKSKVAPRGMEIGACVVEQRKCRQQWWIWNGRVSNVDCVIIVLCFTLKSVLETIVC